MNIGDKIEMPATPEGVRVVRDREGDIWKLLPSGRWSTDPGDNSHRGISWKNILWYAPLEVVEVAEPIVAPTNVTVRPGTYDNDAI